jgi:hypothetical protein
MKLSRVFDRVPIKRKLLRASDAKGVPPVHSFTTNKTTFRTASPAFDEADLEPRFILNPGASGNPTGIPRLIDACTSTDLHDLIRLQLKWRLALLWSEPFIALQVDTRFLLLLKAIK